MKTEYIIFGLRAGVTLPQYEEVLYTRSESHCEAKRVMKLLGEKYGCHAMRIVVFDDNTTVDFKKTIAI